MTADGTLSVKVRMPSVGRTFAEAASGFQGFFVRLLLEPGRALQHQFGRV